MIIDNENLIGFLLGVIVGMILLIFICGVLSHTCGDYGLTSKQKLELIEIYKEYGNK